jgi:hypothetical protein
MQSKPRYLPLSSLAFSSHEMMISTSSYPQLIPGRAQLELLLQKHGAQMAEQSQSSEVWGMLNFL